MTCLTCTSANASLCEKKIPDIDQHNLLYLCFPTDSLKNNWGGNLPSSVKKSILKPKKNTNVSINYSDTHHFSD